jgi:uncharacterized protein (DUF1697 family)
LGRYIALVRAINVGGTGLIAMADLRAFFEKLGFAGAQTLLQTGNVVFQTAAKPTTALETLLETEAAQRLGLNTVFMVRTAQEWSALIAANPFRAAAKQDPARLLLMFLKDEPPAAKQRSLQSLIKGRETARVKGKVAYVTYPDGMGKSKFTGAVLERALGTKSTGRNWNTVMKIAELVASA